jgi:hypothetical protein
VALVWSAVVQNTLAQTNDPIQSAVTDTNDFLTKATLRPAAVSQINGKVDYSAGNMDSAVGNNFSASLTLPATRQFGFQADGLYSRISDLNFYGGAGHFFWRNPGIGLLGLTGGYLHRDGFDAINSYQIGAEGQAYYKQFTFGFFSGLGSINYQYDAPFIDTRPIRFVGRLSADYYPLENLRVGASFTTAFDNNLGKVDIEYQTPINGLALTGEGAVGDHGYNHWLLGIRFYFGGKKTLRARQREDDPPELTPDILHDLGVYGAEYNHNENAFFAAHPGSSPGNGNPSNDGGGSYGSDQTTSYITITQLPNPITVVFIPPPSNHHPP